MTFDSSRGGAPVWRVVPLQRFLPLALVSRADVSVRLLGEEGEEAGAVGLRLDVNDGGLLGE